MYSSAGTPRSSQSVSRPGDLSPVFLSPTLLALLASLGIILVEEELTEVLGILLLPGLLLFSLLRYRSIHCHSSSCSYSVLICHTQFTIDDATPGHIAALGRSYQFLTPVGSEDLLEDDAASAGIVRSRTARTHRRWKLLFYHLQIRLLKEEELLMSSPELDTSETNTWENTSCEPQKQRGRTFQLPITKGHTINFRRARPNSGQKQGSLVDAAAVDLAVKMEPLDGSFPGDRHTDWRAREA
ncbi:hypothetical protein CBS63078_10409 [Aspergillus niger]|nr:hypothetical protein CBS115989_9492 [Aspergillus niger]KAI2825762.1 hypothetical protein CBS133816_8210 [Aspergillus niger]KAI2834160.1 hypothetical protein CBS11350_10917 [Aspergillus niger]KAI2837206.1 hypothetical protein CBS11232_9974 [Aspergillus niger]KAI2842868.1 hypothetical protein CBS12448_10191 [Aspergillus niger]